MVKVVDESVEESREMDDIYGFMPIVGPALLAGKAAGRLVDKWKGGDDSSKSDVYGKGGSELNKGGYRNDFLNDAYTQRSAFLADAKKQRDNFLTDANEQRDDFLSYVNGQRKSFLDGVNGKNSRGDSSGDKGFSNPSYNSESEESKNDNYDSNSGNSNPDDIDERSEGSSDLEERADSGHKKIGSGKSRGNKKKNYEAGRENGNKSNYDASSEDNISEDDALTLRELYVLLNNYFSSQKVD